jgi:hypothetical protein
VNPRSAELGGFPRRPVALIWRVIWPLWAGAANSKALDSLSKLEGAERVPVASSDPSFFARLALAFAAFFKVLFSAAYAGRVARLAGGEPALPEPAPRPEPKKPEAPKLHLAPTDGALQLLGLLQREGRFIDFVLEDVSGYSDAEIGAAARVVHDSVRKAFTSHLDLVRVRNETEGARVNVPKGFSPNEVRLTGNVVGEAPFQGTLTHAGWRVTRFELPQLSEGHDLKVLAPAEVEL